MKKLSPCTARQSGFTAAEMVVSTMVMAILGIIFLNVLNSGMILYAKNTAVNSAHEQGREGINRLTRDIHAAVQHVTVAPANYQMAGQAFLGTDMRTTPMLFMDDRRTQ